MRTNQNHDAIDHIADTSAEARQHGRRYRAGISRLHPAHGRDRSASIDCARASAAKTHRAQRQLGLGKRLRAFCPAMTAWKRRLGSGSVWIQVLISGLAASRERLHIGSMVLDSIITCPHCGHQATETMPTDACQFFYDCKGCKTRLKPKPGDCCVFCSYGTVPCPPIQAGDCCHV